MIFLLIGRHIRIGAQLIYIWEGGQIVVSGIILQDFTLWIKTLMTFPVLM